MHSTIVFCFEGSQDHSSQGSRTEGGTEVANLGAGSIVKDGNYEVEIIRLVQIFYSGFIILPMQEEQPHKGNLSKNMHLLPFVCLEETRQGTLYISLLLDR